MARRGMIKTIGVGAVLGVGALVGATVSQCSTGVRGPAHAPEPAVDEDETPPDVALKTEDVVDPDAPLPLEVLGSRCRVAKRDFVTCEQACKDALTMPNSVIQVDGVRGSHGVVTELQTCLQDGGREVSMKSE